VRVGQYASADEVASAALRLLRPREERRAEVREELDGIFREMDGGKHVEPTDEEFATPVRERAAKDQRG